LRALRARLEAEVEQHGGFQGRVRPAQRRASALLDATWAAERGLERWGR
jgi:hypothetical protein